VKLGFRGRLFFVSVVLVVAAVVSGGVYLEGELRSELETRIEGELERQVHTLLLTVGHHGITLERRRELDAEADKLGATTSARITFIAANGEVVGDSEVPATDLVGLDNHSNRPEVTRALEAGVGRSRRMSATTGEETIYVAVPTDTGAVIRAGTSLRSVDKASGRLVVLLVFAGLIAVGVSVAMSALASQLISRQLRALVENARALSSGAGLRIPVPAGSELTGLAGSLNRLADELENTVNNLASERGRLEAILEGMSEAVIALDADLRIEMVNPAAIELLGVEEPPLGQTLLETVRAPELQDIATNARRGETATTEFELQSRGLRLLATATPDRGGGCILVLHDVTEVRRLERVRRDFVANVSHELRTPIAVVRANVETLLDGGIDDADFARRSLEALMRHAERLSVIIGDLLDISRLEAGRYGLEPQPVDVRKAVNHTMELVADKAADRSVALEIDAAGEVSALADPAALDQVLVNLVDNAVKYNREGGHVKVSFAVVDDNVRIEVADDGPGIEARHRERIFERFYRVDASRSRELGGTGLGLSIVKHLVESLGGQVGCEPAMPRGTRFWLTLPVATAQAATT